MADLSQPGSEPRMITHGFDFGAAMDFMLGKLSKISDPSEKMKLSMDLFHQAMGQAMRIEVGQRVLDVESGEMGQVAIDPVPDGEPNDIGIRWDSDPRNVRIVHRGKIVVVLPGT